MSFNVVIQTNYTFIVQISIFSFIFYSFHKEGLDMDLLRSNGETLSSICKQNIEEMKDNELLFMKWKYELCENRCSVNGHCHQGVCKCNSGSSFLVTSTTQIKLNE